MKSRPPFAIEEFVRVRRAFVQSRIEPISVAASVLQFGTYQAAVQAFDAAGHQSNVITATFQVQ